jgi:hypothetical protein
MMTPWPDNPATAMDSMLFDLFILITPFDFINSLAWTHLRADTAAEALHRIDVKFFTQFHNAGATQLLCTQQTLAFGVEEAFVFVN